jgi:hypothetical protein
MSIDHEDPEVRAAHEDDRTDDVARNDTEPERSEGYGGSGAVAVSALHDESEPVDYDRDRDEDVTVVPDDADAVVVAPVATMTDDAVLTTTTGATADLDTTDDTDTARDTDTDTDDDAGDEVVEPAATTAGDTESSDVPAVFVEDVEGLRSRWQALQVGFVDDPKAAVGEAADLVGDVVERFTAALEGQRDQLRSAWSDDGAADTEHLRLALRRYRDLLDRLLDA